MNEDDLQTQPAAATLVTHGSSPRLVAPSSDRDRYAMGEQLGRGGMGEVRLAHDVRIDRDVAVKLMRPDMRDDASTMRFFREARIQGRLDHPAIPPVYDLGVDEHGSPYFVMKRLTGTTLYDVLAGHPDAAKWPRRQLLAKLVDVCLAVELAHSRVLSLGVTRIVATSASRFKITYTAAISIASAWMTGKSWLTTASWIAVPMPV